MRVTRTILLLALLSGPAAAQSAATPPQAAPAQPPAPPTAAAKPAEPAKPDAGAREPDTWIFSGVLRESSESFSGTLITSEADTQFELKLGGGATCDGGDLRPSLGLVRLSEIHCTDGRSLRALFVPQEPQTLKVFGHVGDARFAAVAHLLGSEPPPERKPSLAPHAPMPLPPALQPPR